MIVTEVAIATEIAEHLPEHMSMMHSYDGSLNDHKPMALNQKHQRFQWLEQGL